MQKLKTILHFNWFYLFLIISIIFYSIFYLSIPHESKLNLEDRFFVGRITEIKISGDLLTIQLKGIESIIGNYYFQTEEEKNAFEKNYELGDTIYISGTFSEPKNNTVPNLFNYKEYLNRKGIYYLMQINDIEMIQQNRNLFYQIKNLILNHINNYKSKSYLKTFILGNTDLLDLEAISTYQEIGISHLFAVSGMHISLLGGILLMLFKQMKLSENKSYLITILFLFFFMFLSGNTASVSRSVILFSLLWLNKLFHLELKTIQLLIITFCILVSINPNILFDVGFEFSFTICFYLILLQDKIKNSSYGKTLLKVSIISFLASLPISIYYFYQINLLSIVFNLFFVPLVSIIIFPFSIITFFISPLDSILLIITNMMEKLAYVCNQISVFKLIFMKPNLLWIVLYYLGLTFFFRGKRKGIGLCSILVLIQYFYLVLFPQTYFMMVDVGQGDSLLIHFNNETVLMDTGGKVTFPKEEWQQRNTQSLADTTLLPLLKSLGIRKIDYLILSHGDYDHMGEAINLVENFKVDKVIFNVGDYNELETQLIEVLNNKKIDYYQGLQELSLGDYKLQFLNSGIYANENDNSNVIYLEFNTYKFLFMGDAGVEKEKDILDQYNLKDIDFLKVGHHGSNTSSSKEFIDSVNPKHSLISVGKNNRYGHPKDEVLETLSNSKIYRTDIDGSIEIKLNRNGYKIRTYSP